MSWGPRRKAKVEDSDANIVLSKPKLTTPRSLTQRRSSEMYVEDLHAAIDFRIEHVAEVLMQSEDVNVTDIYGRTPLHRAAETNFLQAADWLIWFKADPHFKDFEGFSPLSLSGDSEEMVRILSQNIPRYKPELLLLLKDNTYNLHDLDIMLHTDSTFDPAPVYIICRRMSPSKSTLRSSLHQGEVFWRDVVEYKTSMVSSHSLVRVEMLIVDKPSSSSSDLFIRTENMDRKLGEIEADLSPFYMKGSRCWRCSFSLVLDFQGCFALCSRPRSEVLHVPRGGGRVVSNNNPAVRLSVPPAAFKRPGNVLFTIEEVPELERDAAILSMSHFYSMQHSTCSESQGDIEVTLPIPEGYTGEGEVVVLSRPSSSATCTSGEESDEEGEEDLWVVKEATVTPRDQSVSFMTNRLGINTPVEVKRGANREELRAQTARIFSKRAECHVRFLVVGKALGFNQFDVIVECVKSEQIYLRMSDWKTESYTKLRVSGDFVSRQNQKYRLELRGNLKCLYGISDLNLEFLPGQSCHQSLLLTVEKVSDAPNGSIAIREMVNGRLKVVTHLPLLLKEQLELSGGLKQSPRTPRRIQSYPGEAEQPSNTPRRIQSYPGEVEHAVYSDNNGHPRRKSESEVGNDSVVVDSIRNESERDNLKSSTKRDYDEVDAVAEHPKGDMKLRMIPQDDQLTHHRVIHSSTRRTGRIDNQAAPIQQTAQRRRSSDCLPAGVGADVTLGGAAAGEPVNIYSRRQFSEGDGVSAEQGATAAAQPRPVTRQGRRDIAEGQPRSVTRQDTASGFQESTQTDLSAPVSDAFCAQLVRVLPPDFLIFIPLGLTSAELKRIQRNTAAMDTEFTMFEMLVQCRRKRGDNSAFLHCLLHTLEQCGYNDTKQWVLDWTTRWLSGFRNQNGEFAKQIRSIVTRFQTD